MILTFGNRIDGEQELARGTRKELNAALRNYLTEHNYEKPYYYRYWLSGDTSENRFLTIDFGSWSKFFYMYLEEGDSEGELIL